MRRSSMFAAFALCGAALTAQNISYVPTATPDISAGNTIPFGSAAYTYMVRIPASFMDLNQRKVQEIALMPAFTSTFTAPNMLIGLGHLPTTIPCPFTFPSAGAATIGNFLDFTVIYNSATQGTFSWPGTTNAWSPLGFAAAGGTSFTWNGVNDVGLYFTYSGGSGGGAIRRAPTGPNTRTYASTYQAATSTACEALFAAVVCLTFKPGYTLTATTTGGGVGDLTLDPTDSLDAPGHAFGYTFVSFLTAGFPGSGPAFGLYPDSNVFAILTTPVSVGNPLAYVVVPGLYPETNLSFPAGALSFLNGVTADFMQVGFDASQALLFYTNVSRVTF